MASVIKRVIECAGVSLLFGAVGTACVTAAAIMPAAFIPQFGEVFLQFIAWSFAVLTPTIFIYLLADCSESGWRGDWW